MPGRQPRPKTVFNTVPRRSFALACAITVQKQTKHTHTNSCLVERSILKHFFFLTDLASTAFPINNRVTVRPYRVARTRDQRYVHDVLQQAYAGKDMMLYVHWPFCETRYAEQDPPHALLVLLHTHNVRF